MSKKLLLGACFFVMLFMAGCGGDVSNEHRPRISEKNVHGLLGTIILAGNAASGRSHYFSKETGAWILVGIVLAGLSGVLTRAPSRSKSPPFHDILVVLFVFWLLISVGLLLRSCVFG